MEIDAKSVRCPICEAFPGEPCHNVDDGRLHEIHVMRLTRAKRKNAQKKSREEVHRAVAPIDPEAAILYQPPEPN